jgi:hypothetical protein
MVVVPALTPVIVITPLLFTTVAMAVLSLLQSCTLVEALLICVELPSHILNSPSMGCTSACALTLKVISLAALAGAVQLPAVCSARTHTSIEPVNELTPYRFPVCNGVPVQAALEYHTGVKPALASA